VFDNLARIVKELRVNKKRKIELAIKIAILMI
jgi:hypothetical protein